MNNNPFLSGLRSGQAMGQGINTAMNGSPIENAMAEIQNGADAGTVYQKLLSQDPAAAQQLMQFIQMKNQQNNMSSGGNAGVMPMGNM